MYIPEYLQTIEKYESYVVHRIYSGKYGRNELYFLDFIDRHGAMRTDRTVTTREGKVKIEMQLRKCYSDENESAFRKNSVEDIIFMLYETLRKVFGDNITITFDNNILTFVTNYEAELKKWKNKQKERERADREKQKRIEEERRRETTYKEWSEMKHTFTLLTPCEQESMRDQQKVYGIIDNWKKETGF